MKKFISIAIAIILVCTARAQKADGIIKGKLADTSSHKPIADATVSVLRAKDTSLLSYIITGKDGLFEFKNLAAGKYFINITHQEFAAFAKLVSITATEKIVDFNEIILSHDLKTLGEVVVTSEAPIVIKGDTVQFNASRFKTQPNATAEDLIKKLPGMEVDRQGNVKTQGEAVQKVYVDGKEFFGNDPKMATRNITADMIESVQVYDDMSEQAKFTRIDDGSRSKTINIKLKKDRKKGFFARTLASYGDRGYYEGNAALNKFDDKQRLSLIFNANNINRQGFSSAEGGRGGGGQGRSSGGSGIVKSISAGLNYNDDWNPKIKVSGSYFYSKSNSIQEQGQLRRSTFEDSVAVLSKERSSENNSQSHRFNLRFEYQMDSMTSVLYTPSLNFNYSDNTSQDTSFTFSETPSGKFLSINGKTGNNNKNEGLSMNNGLLIRRRFDKTGRTLTIGWNNSYSGSDGDGLVLSHNNFFAEDGSLYRVIRQDQQNKQKTRTNNNVLSTSYTEPLGVDRILEFNYAYTQNKSNSDRKTYDYDSLSRKYDNLNLPLTNNFENSFIAHRAGTNYRYQHIKYNYQLGFALQQSVMESKSYQALNGKDSLTRASYINFFPTANLNFTPGRTKNIRLSYNGRTNPPSVSQLQSVLDVTDPLNVRTGNPDLKQEFNHNVNIGYNTFNVKSSRFLALNASFSTTSNRIVNSIDTLSKGVQLTRPENVNGTYRLNSYITLGFPFKNPDLKGSAINLSNNTSFNRDISLLYKRKNIGQTLSVNQSAAINITKEKYDFAVRANITYTKVSYSVNKSLNEDYYTQNYSGDFAYTFKGDIILATEFDYFINTGREEGYNQQIPIWNARISKQFFRKKNGELRLSVNDILNQNESITRTASDNYILDTRSIVLRRYFLVSFFFNVNKMGGRQKKTDN
jgi:hypothetical protein